MQNEFDDHIKKQVDGFKLTPSPQIWDLVEAQLPEKQCRRLIFWWFVLSAIFVGFCVYEFVGNKKEDKNLMTERTIIQIHKTIKKDSTNNLFTINTLKIKRDKNIIKSSQDNVSESINNYGKKKLRIKNNITKKIKFNNIENELNNKMVLKKGNFFIKKEEEKSEVLKDEINTDSSKNNVEKEKLAAEISKESIGLIINKDSIVNQSAKKEIEITKEDTASFKNKKTNNKINGKNVKWELIALIGSSNTVGKAFGINNGSTYDLSNNVFASPGNGNTSSTAILSLPTSGISIGFNLQRTKQLNKNIAWYGSIGYHYLSNHQASGVLVDSSAIVGGSISTNFSQSTTANNDKVANYYKYGNLINHYNYVHLLNLSTGIKYSISNAFSLNVGFGFAYQIKSKWLQPDLTKNVLYYSDKLTNKWDFETRLGIDWQFNRQFGIGFFYNYSFNKASLAEVQPGLHWQSFGAKLSIKLPFKK